MCERQKPERKGERSDGFTRKHVWVCKKTTQIFSKGKVVYLWENIPKLARKKKETDTFLATYFGCVV